MNYGHGSTSNSPGEKSRRRSQPKTDEARREANRQKSIKGGQPNELGVTQGQNGEQGNTVEKRNSYSRGRVAH